MGKKSYMEDKKIKKGNPVEKLMIFPKMYTEYL